MANERNYTVSLNLNVNLGKGIANLRNFVVEIENLVKAVSSPQVTTGGKNLATLAEGLTRISDSVGKGTGRELSSIGKGLVDVGAGAELLASNNIGGAIHVIASSIKDLSKSINESVGSIPILKALAEETSRLAEANARLNRSLPKGGGVAAKPTAPASTTPVERSGFGKLEQATQELQAINKLDEAQKAHLASQEARAKLELDLAKAITDREKAEIDTRIQNLLREQAEYNRIQIERRNEEIARETREAIRQNAFKNAQARGNTNAKEAEAVDTRGLSEIAQAKGDLSEAERRLESIKTSAAQGNIFQRLFNTKPVIEAEKEVERLKIELDALERTRTIHINLDDEKKKLAQLKDDAIRESQANGSGRISSSFASKIGASSSRIKGHEEDLESVAKGSAAEVAKLGGKALETGIKGAAKEAGALENAGKSLGSVISKLGLAMQLGGGQASQLGVLVRLSGNSIGSAIPAIEGFITALGPLAPFVAAAAIAIAGFAVAAVAMIAGLYSIISAGLAFNSEFDKTINSVAAIVDQFYNVKTAGEALSNAKIAPNSGGIDETVNAVNRFSAAQEIARKELKLLSFEAVRSEYTTQQLFSAFQAASGALAPIGLKLSETRILTGQFARAASIAKVSAGDLASSIAQIANGTVRVTNPLYRVIRTLNDSNGLPLTAQHLRELRAEGGKVFFKEVNTALEQFTKLAGDAQAKTLPGIISNFQDLFGLFSGDVTERLYDALVGKSGKGGLQTIIERFVGNTGEYKKPLQDLFGFIEPLINKIGQDGLRLINFIFDGIETLFGFLNSNSKVIYEIYDTIVSIVQSVFDVVGAFTDLFNIISNTGNNLTFIQGVLAVINIFVAALADAFSLIDGAVSIVLVGVEGLAHVVVQLALGVSKLLSNLPGQVGRNAAKDVDDLKGVLRTLDRAIDHSSQNVVDKFGKVFSGDGAIAKTVDRLSRVGTTGFDKRIDKPITEESPDPKKDGIEAAKYDNSKLQAAIKAANDRRKAFDEYKKILDDIRSLNFDILKKQLDYTKEFAEQRVEIEKNAQQRIAVLNKELYDNLAISSKQFSDSHFKQVREDAAAELKSLNERQKLRERAFNLDVRNVGNPKAQSVKDILGVDFVSVINAAEDNVKKLALISKKAQEVPELNPGTKAAFTPTPVREDADPAVKKAQQDSDSEADKQATETFEKRKLEFERINLLRNEAITVAGRNLTQAKAELDNQVKLFNISQEYRKSEITSQKEIYDAKLKEIEANKLLKKDAEDQARAIQETLNLTRQQVAALSGLSEQVARQEIAEKFRKAKKENNDRVEALGSLVDNNPVDPNLSAAEKAALESNKANLKAQLKTYQDEINKNLEVIQVAATLEIDFKENNEDISRILAERDRKIAQIQRLVSIGQITKLEGATQTRSLEEQYTQQLVEPLKEAEELARKIGTTEAADKFNRILDSVKQFTSVIDEVGQSIRDNLTGEFETLFSSVNDGFDGLSKAAANFGKNILKMFQQLAVKRLVNDLFGSYIDKVSGLISGKFPEQTQRNSKLSDQRQNPAFAGNKGITEAEIKAGEAQRQLDNKVPVLPTDAASLAKIQEDKITETQRFVNTILDPINITIKALETSLGGIKTNLDKLADAFQQASEKILNGLKLNPSLPNPANTIVTTGADGNVTGIPTRTTVAPTIFAKRKVVPGTNTPYVKPDGTVAATGGGGNQPISLQDIAGLKDSKSSLQQSIDNIQNYSDRDTENETNLAKRTNPGGTFGTTIVFGTIIGRFIDENTGKQTIAEAQKQKSDELADGLAKTEKDTQNIISILSKYPQLKSSIDAINRIQDPIARRGAAQAIAQDLIRKIDNPEKFVGIGNATQPVNPDKFNSPQNNSAQVPVNPTGFFTQNGVQIPIGTQAPTRRTTQADRNRDPFTPTSIGRVTGGGGGSQTPVNTIVIQAQQVTVDPKTGKIVNNQGLGEQNPVTPKDVADLSVSNTNLTTVNGTLEQILTSLQTLIANELIPAIKGAVGSAGLGANGNILNYVPKGLNGDQASVSTDENRKQYRNSEASQADQLQSYTKEGFGDVAQQLIDYFNSPQAKIAAPSRGSINQGSFLESIAYLLRRRNVGDNVLLPGETLKRADGGHILGAGTATSDSIPAMLSNGEFVMKAEAVKSYGVELMHLLNKGKIAMPKFVDGGYVNPIDEAKYNYSEGGAKLINLPPAIQELVKPKKKKKGGGFFGIFRNILGAAAPFLNLIPGIGPILSQVASVVGSGTLGGQIGSLAGGAFGAIGVSQGGQGIFSKLGGLSSAFDPKSFGGQSAGLLGKLSPLLGILKGGIASKDIAGNGGNQSLGQLVGILPFLLQFLNRGNSFNGLKNKDFSGLSVRNPNLAASGGLITPFGVIRKYVLGDEVKGKSSPKDDALLALLVGIPGLLGSLVKSKQLKPYVNIDDPDAARKNLYGSAYDTLGDLGAIPRFNYSPDTLKRLRFQGGIPFFLSGQGIPGGGLSYRDATNRPPQPKFKFNFGGMVKGAGTGTSDSIPAMLSNGEFVIKASSVANIGTDILNSINEGRLKFADGGLVGGDVINNLPDSTGASPEVNVDGRTRIVNVLDPSVMEDYLRSSEGEKVILNVLRKNPQAIRSVR